jgi:hypothetical protein
LAITAEALNTITSPTKTSSKVTMNNQRSTLTRFAMRISFHHGDIVAGCIVGQEFRRKGYFCGSFAWVEEFRAASWPTNSLNTRPRCS